MFRAEIAPEKSEGASGLIPGKDDNEVLRDFRRNSLTVSMGVLYQDSGEVEKGCRKTDVLRQPFLN